MFSITISNKSAVFANNFKVLTMKVGKLIHNKCTSLYIQLSNFHQQGIEIVCKNTTFVTERVKEHNLWRHQIKFLNINISRTKSDIENI